MFRSLEGVSGCVQSIHFCSVLWGYVRKDGVFEDAAVEKLHDVEVGADDLFVLTET